MACHFVNPALVALCMVQTLETSLFTDITNVRTRRLLIACSAVAPPAESRAPPDCGGLCNIMDTGKLYIHNTIGVARI